MEDIHLGAILGATMGFLVSAVILLDVGVNMGYENKKDITTMENIQEIRQAEIDCLVKEYYYIDEHRQFCDMIGVRP